MPRKITLLQSEFPYHIGARCINREWFGIPLEDVWNVMSEQLFFIHHAFEAKIHAFILMQNHFHLIMKTPLANLDDVMEWFMRETSRSLVRAGNRINQTYGGPYFRCIIKSHHYYLNAYKYLYHNPIKAGVCKHVLEYPYSTLPGLLGQRHLLIPVEEDVTLFSDVEGTLRWLNERPCEDSWTAVRTALRKTEFRFPKDKSVRLHSLETDTL